MTFAYDVAYAARLRDWDLIDKALADQGARLDICMARSKADGERLPPLDAPDPVTMHDLPPGALIVVDIDPFGNRKLRP